MTAPTKLREQIKTALKSYRCQFSADEDGHLSLFDVLTPKSDVDIGRGKQEIELLADYVAAALAPPSGEGVDSAEHKLAAAGVFAGHRGLRGLVEHDAFWEKQAYGTRLYYGDGGTEYLHRGVLRAAVAILDNTTPQSAPVDGEFVLVPKSLPPKGICIILDYINRNIGAIAPSVMWQVLLAGVSAPPPASQERGDTTFRPGWRFDPGSVHAVPDFASSDMARQQREQYLNSPEGLQWRQTVALEKLAASPPSSAAEELDRAMTDDELMDEIDSIRAAEQANEFDRQADKAFSQAMAEQAKPERLESEAVGLESGEQAQAGELPPLPVTTYCADADGTERLYTADQMHAYANAALLRRVGGGVTVDDAMVKRAADTWRYYTGSLANDARMRAALVAALGAR